MSVPVALTKSWHTAALRVGGCEGKDYYRDGRSKIMAY